MQDLPDGELDSISLHQARSDLASFSIVSVHEASGNMTMHPLAHAWARDRLKAPEKQKARVSAGCVLALSMEGSLSYDPFWMQLQPHVESYIHAWPLESSVVLFEIVQCFFYFGTLLTLMRNDLEGEWVFEFIIDCKSDKIMPGSENILPVQHCMAICYGHLGKASKAVELLEEVVQIKKTTLKPEHPSRLASEELLATALSHR